MNTQKIQELKEQGFKIIKFEIDGKEFYLRKPSKGELMLYQDEALKNKGSVAGRSEKFIRQLFVGDNAEEFANYLEEKPLAIGNFLEECLKGLGADENFTATEI
ncbi:MAG: hypothetical protein ACRC0X_09395 [Brevinema sp.]